MEEIQRFTASVNKEHLLRNLIKHNSQDPNTPIREYISNAYDASLGFEDAEIFVWAERDRICIEDTGAGMTQKILLEGFTRIAGHISREDESESIGMFGIGVLSAFMVAHTLEVHTKHDDETHGWKLIWSWAKDEAAFTLSPLPKDHRGTLVILHLSEDYYSLASNKALKSFICKTFALLKVPIKIGRKDQAEIINPSYRWMKQLEEEGEGKKLILGRDAQEFFREFSPVPLAAAYTSLDANNTRVFLGIPSKEYQRFDNQDVHFFSKGIKISSRIREYFPTNLGFVIGVIESPHFQLQMSREAINTEDSFFKKIKSEMEYQIIECLKLIAEKSPNTLEAILKTHSAMLISHKGNLRPELIQIYKENYSFTTSAGKLKWKQILAFIPKNDGKKVLYIITDSLGAFQDIFLKRTRNFIAVSVFDEDLVLLEEIAHGEQVRLVNIQDLDETDGEVVEIPEVFRKFGASITPFLIHRRIGGVNFANLPGEDQFPTFFRMRAESGKVLMPTVGVDQSLNDQHIEALMLNVAHPLIQKLAGNESISQQQLKETADILYFISVINSPFVELMLEISKEITKSLIETIESKTNLIHRPQLSPYDHPTTFIAFPYGEEFNTVWEGVSDTLRNTPYNWDIIRGDRQVDKPDLIDNINHHIQKSHRYIADISGLNKNVIYELGIMEGVGADRTLIICDEETFPTIPANLKGRILKTYPSSLRKNKGEFKTWFEKVLPTLPWWENLQGTSSTSGWKAGHEE